MNRMSSADSSTAVTELQKKASFVGAFVDLSDRPNSMPSVAHLIIRNEGGLDKANRSNSLYVSHSVVQLPFQQDLRQSGQEVGCVVTSPIQPPRILPSVKDLLEMVMRRPTRSSEFESRGPSRRFLVRCDGPNSQLSGASRCGDEPSTSVSVKTQHGASC